MATQSLDQEKAEAFAGKMLQVLNDGFLALLTSLGHRTGLFDAMAGLPPSTSEQIAEATGLNERYVREWLGGMVVGRLVDYDPASATYQLPAEHAAFLTRAAGTDNMAFFCQYLSLVGEVESQVVECVRSGGGVPYSAFPQFQALQAEESRPLYDAALVNVMLPMVPRHRRAVAGRAGRCRRGLRPGPCRERDGAGFPEQPLRRPRLLGGSDRGRAGRG